MDGRALNLGAAKAANIRMPHMNSVDNQERSISSRDAESDKNTGTRLLVTQGDGEDNIAETRHMRLVARAMRSLEARARRPGATLNNPRILGDWFRLKLAEYEHEVFAAAWLDNRLRLIAFEELFRGTHDRTQIPVREVVKAALRVNAAAVAFAHNHPSGWPEPSPEDVRVAEHLRDALALVDVRIVDQLVITSTAAPRSLAWPAVVS